MAGCICSMLAYWSTLLRDYEQRRLTSIWSHSVSSSSCQAAIFWFGEHSCMLGLLSVSLSPQLSQLKWRTSEPDPEVPIMRGWVPDAETRSW